MLGKLWMSFPIVWAASLVSAAQIPMSLSSFGYRTERMFSGVQVDEFTVLRHPAFPGHSARIKQVDFCDPTVHAYTGYLDVDANHFFFYFFESRSDPQNDDVIYWTNGGPGASSTIGLFMELGPCRITNATEGPQFHPHSWNTNANVLFVDQPAGVGYSYEDHGHLPTSTERIAQDMAATLALFFTSFPTLKGRRLHLAGESYGGRYIPLFASAVYDQNAALIEAGLEPLNLVSAMIGNGQTDRIDNLLSYYDFTCTPATVPPVFDVSTCVRMKAAKVRCERWAKAACETHFDFMDCQAAEAYCAVELQDPFVTLGLNFYDITEKADCLGTDLCYPVIGEITQYLNRTDVREMLGVDPRANVNLSTMSWDVFWSMTRAGDVLHSSKEHVAALLAHGVRVLLYVGANDWSANWVGTEKWSRELDWFGHADFAAQPLRAWNFDGTRAGVMRSAHGFTFLTVDGAGHMAPYNKPAETLSLIQRWIADEPI